MLKKSVTVKTAGWLKMSLLALTATFVGITTINAQKNNKTQFVHLKNDLYSFEVMKGFEFLLPADEINKRGERDGFKTNYNGIGQSRKKEYSKEFESIGIRFYTPINKETNLEAKIQESIDKITNNKVNKDVKIQTMQLGNKKVVYVNYIGLSREYNGTEHEYFGNEFFFHDGTNIFRIDVPFIKDLSKYMDDIKYMISSFSANKK
ncbi:MAG: hypothetical protein LBT50_03150 [Prevotellaceae bacterium]|jgi:hypothetical protein|nr:hypothetical protein [Prevotellaceae bacterium]